MNHTKHIVNLLQRYLKDELDVAGHAELQAWADSHPAYRQLLDDLKDEAQLRAALKAYDEVYDDEEESAVTRMQQRIAQGVAASQEPVPVRRLSWFRWARYAAAVALFLTIGIGWYYYNIYNNKTQVHLSSSPYGADVLPGSNRATLTLADGRIVELSALHEGIIVEDDKIRYTHGSVLVDDESSIVGEDNNGQGYSNIQYAILATPRGGQYQVVLPDGSKVWLNADSKLKYPMQFAEDKREVELEGEAYFEISSLPALRSRQRQKKQSQLGANDKIPFLVKTRDQVVEVLGTQFNISAYADEPETKTTLVEGAVHVSNLSPANQDASSQRSRRLNPGQQSTVRGGSLTVREVDVYSFISWKDGIFLFNETELRTAMNQLSRWYDVAVEYQGDIPPIHFYGEISRDKSLAAVLDIFKEGGLRFKIEKEQTNHKLIVLP